VLTSVSMAEEMSSAGSCGFRERRSGSNGESDW
jgi:hypothetical protein